LSPEENALAFGVWQAIVKQFCIWLTFLEILMFLIKREIFSTSFVTNEQKD